MWRWTDEWDTEPMSESRSPSRGAAHGRSEPCSEGPIREARVFVAESDFEAIGIAELVAVWRDAGLETVETLTCHETGAVVQVAVERPLDADRLGSLGCVDWWEAVSSAGGRRRYLVEFTAPAFPPSITRRSEGLLDARAVGFDERGVAVSLVGPRRAISDVVDEYESAGLSPRLRKFGRYDGRDRPLDALTERQRDLLETAYERGYFEVPRDVTAEEIASAFNMDASTVTEHLQRAKRNLLTRELSAGLR